MGPFSARKQRCCSDPMQRFFSAPEALHWLAEALKTGQAEFAKSILGVHTEKPRGLTVAFRNSLL
jgi:hypothetical protein